MCTCRNLEGSPPMKRLRSQSAQNICSVPSPTSQAKSAVTTWHSYHRKRRGGRGRGPGAYVDPISTRTRSQNTISIERGKFFSIGIDMFEPVRRRRTKTNSSSTDGIISPTMSETTRARKGSHQLPNPAPDTSDNEDVFEDSSSEEEEEEGEEEERKSAEKRQESWNGNSTSPLRYPKSTHKISFWNPTRTAPVPATRTTVTPVPQLRPAEKRPRKCTRVKRRWIQRKGHRTLPLPK